MFFWDAGLRTREREREAGGGGGKPKIRLGRTGPRGRMYSTVAAQRSTPVIAKSKYIKTGKGARSAIREHIRYIQERERGEQERERTFFDRDRGDIERREVYEEMHRSQGRNVAMHTLILSPGDNRTDLQEYTRESMDALEDRLGHKLNWYAVTHENTDHYHAHVVIAGQIPDREREIDWIIYGKDRWHEQEMSASWQREREDIEILYGKGSYQREIEREPIDPRDRDVIQDGWRSAEELKAERDLDRYDRQQEVKEVARERGDVYLDRSDLTELRSAGTDYMSRERELDRELERAFEREFGYGLDLDRELDRDRDRDVVRELEREDMWDLGRIFEYERELELEQPDRGDSRDSRGDRENPYNQERDYDRDRDEDEDRERDRDDDFDRGRW